MQQCLHAFHSMRLSLVNYNSLSGRNMKEGFRSTIIKKCFRRLSAGYSFFIFHFVSFNVAERAMFLIFFSLTEAEIPLQVSKRRSRHYKQKTFKRRGEQKETLHVFPWSDLPIRALVYLSRTSYGECDFSDGHTQRVPRRALVASGVGHFSVVETKNPSMLHQHGLLAHPTAVNSRPLIDRNRTEKRPCCRRNFWRYIPQENCRHSNLLYLLHSSTTKRSQYETS